MGDLDGFRVGAVPPNGTLDPGVISIDPALFDTTELSEGDAVYVVGDDRTPARVTPSDPADKGLGIVRMSSHTRHNAGVSFGETIDLVPTHTVSAQSIHIEDDGTVSAPLPSGLLVTTDDVVHPACDPTSQPVSRGWTVTNTQPTRRSEQPEAVCEVTETTAVIPDDAPAPVGWIVRTFELAREMPISKTRLSHVFQHLTHENAFVRRYATKTAVEIATRSPEVLEGVTRRLVWLLDDDDQVIRADAAWILAKLEVAIEPDHFPSLVEALVERFSASDPHTRERAFEALCSLKPAGALAHLYEVHRELPGTSAEDATTDTLEAVIGAHRNRLLGEAHSRALRLEEIIEARLLSEAHSRALRLEEIIEARLLSEAHSRASNADEMRTTANTKLENSAATEAAADYAEAAAEYDRAATLATRAGADDQAATYETKRTRVEERRTFARVARISQSLDKVVDTIADDPDAAITRLTDHIDELGALDVPNRLQDDLERVRQTAREHLWVAHVQSVRNQIREADRLLADDEFFDARDAYRTAREMAAGFDPPDQAVAPNDATDVATLQERCSMQATAVERCLVSPNTHPPEPLLESSSTADDRAGDAVDERAALEQDVAGADSNDARRSDAVSSRSSASTAPDSDASTGSESSSLVGDQHAPPEFVTQTVLARGGNATVYRVELLNGDVAALKRPHFQNTIEFDDRERFLSAASKWAAIDDDPRIVTVRDYGDDGMPWLLLEYVEDGDLRDHVNDLSLQETVDVLVDVAAAISHARGVDHLDLKPANILVDSIDGDLTAKVTDWGLARVAFQNDDIDTRLGISPPYAAPEQVDHSIGSLDHQTDIYQFGALAYELVTGQPPFDPTAPESLETRILNAAPPAPSAHNPAVPASLDTVIETALAKAPADRHDYPALLLSAMRGILSDLEET